MRLKRKSPLRVRGSRFVHRRSMFGDTSVYELAYFIRYGEYRAKFYGNSPEYLISKLGAYALIRGFTKPEVQE